jgi:hypothetical protein
MEDFGKSVKTSRRSRNRNYVPTTVINPAANVLSAIEYVEGAFEDRREKVNLFQQQAEQRRIDLQDLVDDTKRVDQTDAQAKMTEQFSNMVTDIYKADIASFDGDRTDYLNKSNNAQKVISSFPKVIGVVDELSNKIKNMNPAEQKKAILRNQFMGKNGGRQMEYLEFLMDPSKMNLRIQGGDIIITNNGKDLFNGTQLINSVKEGNSLVKVADDYEKEIGAASKDAMTGVKSLVVAKEYETMSKDGTRLSDTQLNDYMGAVNQYKDNLINSGKIDALINESTFQRYTDSPDVYDEKKYGQQTKDAIIDYLVGKEFPMYKKEVNKKGKTIESAIGDKSVKTKIVTPKEKEETKPSPELVTYTEILKPADKLKSLLQNPNQGTRSKELVTEENKMRFEALSKQEKEAKEALEKSLTERFKLQRFGTESTGKIIAGGEIAVNDDGELMYFPKYNRTKDGVTELVTIEDFNNGIPLQEDILFRFEKDLSKVIKSDAKLAKTVNPKNQAEFNKAYAELKPGQSMIVNGITYTKPKK